VTRSLRSSTSTPGPVILDVRHPLKRRVLQIAVVLFSLNAIIGGGLYLFQGLNALIITGGALNVSPHDADWVTLDYFVRALAGVWFTIGLIFAYTTPEIEKHAILLRFACLAIFFMGLGRLLSIISLGAGNNPLIALYLELTIPILLVWGQYVVAKDAMCTHA